MCTTAGCRCQVYNPSYLLILINIYTTIPLLVVLRSPPRSSETFMHKLFRSIPAYDIPLRWYVSASEIESCRAGLEVREGHIL